MTDEQTTNAGDGPVERVVGRPAPERDAMTSDEACRFAVWWAHKRKCFTTARQAAFAAWDQASRDKRSRSQKLADAGFVRRPGLQAMEMRAALELIAAPMRPDGTWNRDRAACQQIAAEALGRYEDSKPPNS